MIYLDRISPAISEDERKSLLLSHYPEHRHLFSHIAKIQRHSDPYSIQWITDGPQEQKDTGNVSQFH